MMKIQHPYQGHPGHMPLAEANWMRRNDASGRIAWGALLTEAVFGLLFWWGQTASFGSAFMLVLPGMYSIYISWVKNIDRDNVGPCARQDDLVKFRFEDRLRNPGRAATMGTGTSLTCSTCSWVMRSSKDAMVAVLASHAELFHLFSNGFQFFLSKWGLANLN